MKVLIDCHTPFILAHGGGQIQIEQTMSALKEIGVSVEPLRWWDESQKGDILHHFGRIPTVTLRQAHEKGLKVVMSPLLGAAGSRSAARRFVQRIVMRAIWLARPGGLSETLSWNSYLLADAIVALTDWEAYLMRKMFQAPAERLHVVPNGVEKVFLNGTPTARGKWLVCTATILELKQILKVAQVAVQAQTPFWAIGKPFSASDAYARQFMDFAAQHPEFVRYEGPIADRNRLAGIYREARGFVLLSKWESLSLSALEASACGCPLLLSDLPWARWSFKEKASYCPAFSSIPATAPLFRRFYEQAPQLPPPPRPLSWTEVAEQFKSIYERVLATSR
jgi:glycosyltransferase involved in cell wall biosynthesis